MLKSMGYGIIGIVVIALVAYATLVGGLYLFQRKLMYHPNTQVADPAKYDLTGVTIQKLTTTDGHSLVAWFAPASDAYPTILYFHGNAENLGERAENFRAFIEKGFGLLAVSYRGFGGSTGSPTEEGLYHDARAALAFLETKGLKSTDLIYYGESLGTGVATQLATEAPPRMLVLEAPYTSVMARAAEIYWYVPVRYLVHDTYDTLGKIGNVKAPLLIFHGEEDPTIPPSHGKAVMAAANNPKKALFFPGVDHTTFRRADLADEIYGYYEETADFALKP